MKYLPTKSTSLLFGQLVPKICMKIENEIKWAQKAGGGPSVPPKSVNALLNSRRVPIKSTKLHA